MKLLLVRHAIAEERDAARWPDDADRPLTQRGMRRFRSAAEGLGTLVPEVDRLITSPFVRAHQTATILQDVLGWAEPEIQPHLASGAPIAGVIALLADCDPESTVAIVGHEPMMSLVMAAYVGGSSARLALDWRRGGVAMIDFDGAPAISAGVLTWYLPPRVLRSLRE